MNKKTQNEIGLMLLLTLIIIFTVAVGIHYLGISAEDRLFTAVIPKPVEIRLENNFLKINCPWEVSDEMLTRLEEDAFPKPPSKDYLADLHSIARLISNNENITVAVSPLWKDENGLLIHKSEHSSDLSYAIDTNKGQIVGAGISSVSETDSAKQSTTAAELEQCIDYYFTDYLNPIAKFRIHQSAYNSLLNLNLTSRPQKYDPYDPNFSYSYPDTDIMLALWSLPRQVSYYQNVLTVIFQEEAQSYILQYDPDTLKITSAWLQES